MSGHTPGPWEVLHDHPNPQTHASLAHIVGPGKDRWNSIASVFGCENATARANACLIAEAPNLLAALRSVVLHGSGYTEARALIEKLKGSP